ncbi:MAG: DUF1905 domain-containing protein [Alteraurantiacibacter sp.]
MSEEWTVTLPLLYWRNPDGIAAGYLAFTGELAEQLVAARALQKLELGPGRGGAGNFGSVKVISRIGSSEWPNALYPEKDGSWGLPVKKAVRVAERLDEGDMVTVTLRFL